MTPQARHVFVSGRVQGVAFRWHTSEKAQALGVTGWVRNLGDGRVEVHVEGEASAVEEMVAWLGHGPSMARVDGIDVREREPEGHGVFEVRRSGF